MRTAITARTCVRVALFAGSFALLALTGCAPAGDEADVSELRATDGNDLPVLDQRAPSPARSALSASERLAEGVGAVRPPAPTLRPSASVAEGAIAALPAFERDAFAAEVDAAGRGYVPGVASLPGAPVADLPGMHAAVAAVVARASGDDVKFVDGDTSAYGADPLGGVWAFSREVASFDGDLSLALHPVALRLQRGVSDLRVTRWSATVHGVTRDVAVTVHGRAGGRLVGVVVFR